MLPELARMAQRPAAHAHALEVRDRLAEHRVAWGWLRMQPAVQALRLHHQQLVVDPAMARKEFEGHRIVGRNVHIRGTRHVTEVLLAPRIELVNWHGPYLWSWMPAGHSALADVCRKTCPTRIGYARTSRVQAALAQGRREGSSKHRPAAGHRQYRT